MNINNVLTRTIVAFIAIPILLAMVFYGSYAFLAMIIIISVLAQFEFFRLIKSKHIEPNYILSTIATISILLLFFLNKTEHLITLIFILFALITIIEMFRKRNNSILNSSASTFVPIFFGLFYGCLIGIREFFGSFTSVNYIRGAYLVSAIMVTIWICDSAAYFGGISLGKHRLFERISPKKTWEGAFFGFIFSIISMVVAKLLFLEFLNWTAIIYFSLVVGIIGQTGDLIESMFKRNANIKDSSTLIPGHGGIYDRFDSLLFVAPFIYFYLVYFY